MNQQELIAAAAASTGLPTGQVAEVITAVHGHIVKTVNRGGRVTLPGFGTYERRARKARTARDLRTGEPIRVAAKKVPAFRPGATFKGYVAEGGKGSYTAAWAKVAAARLPRSKATTSTPRASSRSASATTATARRSATAGRGQVGKVAPAASRRTGQRPSRRG